ncbi:MAG: DUF4105 domain-containing protein [Polyangiaceae bacterium]|nr:DUF4105 domain-containing protein [Polyangiaceae bacterium]
MNRLLALVLGLFLLLDPGVASAWPQPPTRVSVLTMGPGDAAFTRFGHNAILLEWPERDVALVYNFGTFAFPGLEGVRAFVAGRLRYWLSVSTLPTTLKNYADQNRSMVVQQLRLTPEQKLSLARALARNARPDRRYYDYDYYYDNCSTRVRDVLDRVTEGALSRQLKGRPGRLTFREHTERSTAAIGWLYFALDLSLGPFVDRPIRRWEEVFIPSELHDALAGVTLDDPEKTRLVEREQVLLTAARPLVPRDPPSRTLGFTAAGLALGLGLAALGHLAIRRTAARVAFGVLTSVLGLLLGLAGSVFVYFWLFTKHWAASANENILVCPPWALPLAAFGITTALGRTGSSRVVRSLLAACALSAAVAVLLAWIPGFGQDNARTAGLLGPLWMGLYLGYARLRSDHHGQVQPAL